MKKGFAFLNRKWAGYNSKYTRDRADWPPFSAAELNTTDGDGVGNIVVDPWGRAYVKCRYTQTATAGAAGSVVGLDFIHGASTITSASSTVYSIRNGAALGVNEVAGHLIMAPYSALLTSGFMKEVYSNDADTDFVISSERKDILNGNTSAIYDANVLSAVPNNGTAITYSNLPFDVKLAVNNDAGLARMPVGVLLGAVTAASGVLVDSTYYYTWVQIMGPALVTAADCSGGTDGISIGEEVSSSATAGACIGTAVTATTDRYVLGYALQAYSGNTAGFKVPVYIHPTFRPFI